MTSRYRELFEAELDDHNIIWCQGDKWRSPSGGTPLWADELPRDKAEWYVGPCDARRAKGGRHSPSGGAWATEIPYGPTVHLGREVTTRYGLQIALHEVAHIVLGHTERTARGRRKIRKRVYEVEAEAEAWSFERMRELGVAVPEKSRQRAAEYVAYRKRRGDRVIAARARSQDPS